MSPVDNTPIAPVAHAPVAHHSCSRGSVLDENQVPQLIAVEPEQAIAEEPKEVVAESPEEIEIKVTVEQSKKVKAMAEKISARDIARQGVPVISSTAHIGRAACQFRSALKQGMSFGVAELMKARPADWQLILTQTYPYFYKQEYSSREAYGILRVAHHTLSPELQAQTGGAGDDNQQLLSLTLNYMAYRWLKNNGGCQTTVADVQRLLNADKVTFGDGGWTTIKALEHIMHESALNCRKDCPWEKLTVEECNEFLMDMFKEISVYPATRCASLIVKMLAVFSTSGVMNMVLAFGNSPFVGAFKHLENVTEDKSKFNSVHIA